MKNILIVADIYPPEISSAAQLMKELAEGFKKSGNRVIVATSYPRAYLPEEDKAREFPAVCEEDGIKVLRIKTLPLRKVSFILRGISQLVLPIIFFCRIRKEVKEKIDGIIVYSPPLPLALAGGWLKKRFRAKFILNLQDIFPQNAIDLGVLKNGIVIKFFEAIESKVYKTADLITFNSEGGRRFLIEKKNVPEEKIITLYNWVDIGAYNNLNDPISFRKRYGLENKFIFLFGGIMGPAQGLEFLVRVAKAVSDLKDAVFLLVGDGSEKSKIEKEIKDLGADNVVIKSFIPGDEYPHLVKDIDVGLVCLSSENKTPFIPGKILGYMVAGKPVVAFLNKESDGFSIIEKARCGYASKSDDLEAAVKIVRDIYNQKERLKEMGENGFKYALNNLTVEAVVNKLEKSF